ncbi:VOC family protein [Bordetella hinzii]|uniref:VOC family protein n=1 Tax=Bordetella hinzii TaxID=103855 RepID=A0AAN1VEC9_9BORD|nr:VOC family protein [Bordetella hinzii]AKQ54829.1 Glyoxalase-like domain protein [Bordetella hinzii]AKQ59342.1 Glyoxalase-like domain protein [Bordetella hinzii]AZW15417.1 VOC family protein [Bordetella hinzii]KCB31790.1 glyoxalase-like domain protein [Bordetella hinzii L60]KCB48049.1 glyoxalase-like domain protein [Bordetella hinzii 4161]
MLLLDHVSIAVPDLAIARPFYHAIMAVLGARIVYDDADRIGYGERNRPGDDGHSYLAVLHSPDARAAAGRHWCFRAPSRLAVDRFHAAALAHGGQDAGPPGLRIHYHPQYYAAFVLDPAGNRLEAVCHGLD